MHRNKTYLLFSLIFFSVWLSSCSVSPEPINYGKDECEFCRMLISDDRYGAELISDKGKVYKFDSIECLINFALTKNVIGDEKYTLLVTNFSNPGILNDARSSMYIHNNNFRSPMGLNVASFGNDSDAQKFLTDNGGKKNSWLEVIEMVRQHSMQKISDSIL